MRIKHQIQASKKWWIYQIQDVYLRQLALGEITKEQHDKDLNYLYKLVDMYIEDKEQLTFTEFMNRIFN
jgi:hypothetical protein